MTDLVPPRGHLVVPAMMLLLALVRSTFAFEVVQPFFQRADPRVVALAGGQRLLRRAVGALRRRRRTIGGALGMLRGGHRAIGAALRVLRGFAGFVGARQGLIGRGLRALDRAGRRASGECHRQQRRCQDHARERILRLRQHRVGPFLVTPHQS
jgi:hypothetical protein